MSSELNELIDKYNSYNHEEIADSIILNYSSFREENYIKAIKLINIEDKYIIYFMLCNSKDNVLIVPLEISDTILTGKFNEYVKELATTTLNDFIHSHYDVLKNNIKLR